MKKTGLNGYVYDFSVGYILDIDNYLMKKIVQYKKFGFVKKMFFVPMSFFGYNSLNITWKMINVNSNGSSFYRCKVEKNKYSSRFNNINVGFLN